MAWVRMSNTSGAPPEAGTLANDIADLPNDCKMLADYMTDYNSIDLVPYLGRLEAELTKEIKRTRTSDGAVTLHILTRAWRLVTDALRRQRETSTNRSQSQAAAEVGQPPKDCPKDKQTQAQGQPRQLPEELRTDEAKRYIDKAIEVGLMDDGYQWKQGLQMLACFCYEMSLNLKLGKGENSDGTPRISWRPFEDLFCVPHGKLRQNYNDIQKAGRNPWMARLIDKVFA